MYPRRSREKLPRNCQKSLSKSSPTTLPFFTCPTNTPLEAENILTAPHKQWSLGPVPDSVLGYPGNSLKSPTFVSIWTPKRGTPGKSTRLGGPGKAAQGKITTSKSHFASQSLFYFNGNPKFLPLNFCSFQLC